MAQLIEIKRVAVSPQHFTARVRIANGGPLTTDEDLIGTTHVYNLLPESVLSSGLFTRIDLQGGHGCHRGRPPA